MTLTVNTKTLMGARLKDRREYLKLTQQEVADAISIGRSNYAKYEMGIIDIPSSAIPALAKVLRVPVSYFFGEYDNEAEDEPPAFGFYRSLSFEKQDDFALQMKAVLDKEQRDKTTHGKKAE